MAIVTLQLIHKDGNTRSIAMDKHEMHQLNEAAFTAICKCADDMLEDNCLKRITYEDDEGDLCTLTAVSIGDALRFCDREGVLHLNVESEEALRQQHGSFCMQPMPLPVAPADSEKDRKLSDAGNLYFYIGDSDETQQAESEAVCAAALALLLKHPDAAVRTATQEALNISAGVAAKERSCAEDEWGKTDRLSSREVSEDSDKDLSSQTSEAWEKLDEVVLDPEKISEALPKRKSGKVLCAHTSLTDPEVIIDCADAHGDVTADFGHLLVQYPDVSQAFTLARLLLSHAGNDAKALVKAIVTNDGTEAWPDACSLQLVAGPSLGFPALPLGPVSPGETVELVLELGLRAEGGQPGLGQLSAWAVLDEQGAPFGPLMLVEVGYI
eukprot:TRINITY_DN21216_c0_g1_i1.p1 TRINITY_DN21216_c0_g1~~TRINITY_DN21216_c0_g1_i1.p1  ORF type:complete len:383 (-),score=90.63 TRINITY_DN21216_c0_g1_i1:471-1619(-)